MPPVVKRHLWIFYRIFDKKFVKDVKNATWRGAWFSVRHNPRRRGRVSRPAVPTKTAWSPVRDCVPRRMRSGGTGNPSPTFYINYLTVARLRLNGRRIVFCAAQITPQRTAHGFRFGTTHAVGDGFPVPYILCQLSHRRQITPQRAAHRFLHGTNYAATDGAWFSVRHNPRRRGRVSRPAVPTKTAWSPVRDCVPRRMRSVGTGSPSPTCRFFACDVSRRWRGC